MDESNLEPADDMVTLGDLHEAALLHNVRLRFYNDDIFTYIGPILCAANPYKMIPMFTGEYVSVRRLCFRLWVLRARLETHLRCAARSRQKYFESPVGTVLPPPRVRPCKQRSGGNDPRWQQPIRRHQVRSLHTILRCMDASS